jgi:hypothetical protein
MGETRETGTTGASHEPAQPQPEAGRAPVQAPVAALERTAPLWPGTERISRLWTPARLLASVAAIAFAIVAWTPWVTAIGAASANSQQTVEVSFAPGDIQVPLGSFGWAALTVVGVLLLPLIWLRARRIAGVLGVAAYAIWALAAAVFAFFPMAGLTKGQTLMLDSNLTLANGGSLPLRSLFLTEAPRYQPGYYIGAASLALAIVAAVLLAVGLAQSWRAMAVAERTAMRVRAGSAIPGTGLLVGALLLWAAGTLVFPWATVDCNGLPLIASQCIGLPYTSALRFGISSGTMTFDPLASIYAVDIVLVSGAALLLIGVALRAITARFCLWATLWLAAAAFFALVGRAGVGYAIAHPDALGLKSGHWTGDTGLGATLLALVLGLGAVVYLWVGAIREGRRGAT